MNTLNTAIKLLLNRKSNKKLSKQRTDYLLSALAISALSTQAQAEGGNKSYKIDVKQLAKDAGVKVSDVSNVELKLAEGAKGEVVNLGNGIFEVTLAEGVTDVNFIIGGSGVESVFTSSFSSNGISALKQDFANSWNEFVDGLSSDNTSTTQITADFDASALGLAVLAVAVSGGSSAVASVASVVSLSDLSLTVSKGTLENAQVFLDADNDGVLDWIDADADGAWDDGEGEQWALTDSSGAVTFTQVEAATLVAQAYKVGGVSQTVDAVSGSNVENLQMKADATASVITPLTTLVKAGLTNDDVLKVLGFDAATIATIGDINTYDPFSVANADSASAVAYEKVAAQAFTLTNTIAESVAAGGSTNATEVFSYAVAQLVDQLETYIALLDTAPTTTIDLSDTTTITAIINNTVAAVDTAKGTSVAENLSYNGSSITTNIATAIANTNTQIKSITSFDLEAKSILNYAADGVSTEIKAAVEAQVAVKVEVERLDAIIAAGDESDADVIAAKADKVTELATFETVIKIAAAADVVQYISEDATTENSTFEVAGTTSAGSVDANGTYGNLTHSGNGANWVYTPHTSSDHGQTLNDKQTFTETFIITEGLNTYDVTVVLLGANDDAVITAADPSAITEGDTATDVTVSGTATHTDVDTNNADNLFQAVTAGTASTNAYGTYEVSTAGAWTYTLDSTNATVKALNTASTPITDTITITAEDGTTKAVTITINGSNDAPVVANSISDMSVNEDAVALVLDISGVFNDVDGDTLTYTATFDDVDISNTISGTNMTIPVFDNDDVGTHTISIAANDGDESVSETFTLTVNNTNDAPVITADTKTVEEDSGATLIDVLANDSDVDTTDSLTITQVRSSNGSGTTENNGTVSISDGKVSYTPADNFNGSDSFQYLASDGTTDGGLTTVTVTVNPANDDPTGTVTITGTAKTGQTLTADNTLADVDGLGTISYQWAKDGENVFGATNSTLVLADSDIGSTYTVTASYTDSDDTDESVASSATSAVADIVKLVQVRNITTTGSVEAQEIDLGGGNVLKYSTYTDDGTPFTEQDASLEINLKDYSSASSDPIVKFDLYLDAEGIDSLTASTVTEIIGVELKLALDLIQSDLDNTAEFTSSNPALWDDTDAKADNNTEYMEFKIVDDLFYVNMPNKSTG